MNRRSTPLPLVLVVVMGAAANAQYSGGSGTEADPWQIATAADLIALGQNTGHYGDYFVMTADIDLTGHTFTAAVIAAWDPSSGVYFPPEESRFAGTFDGNGYVIRSLVINADGPPSGGGGLFGALDVGGELRGLGLVDCSVAGGLNMASLVSSNLGTVSSCYATGSVTGHYIVGGLAGFNGGTISACHATNSIMGDPEAAFVPGGVGGLVGVNMGGEISSCYANGSVVGDDSVGGLVGMNHVNSLIAPLETVVSSCYATGSVTGVDSDSARVGGLVGRNVGGTVSSCYATGAVTGGVAVGGLVGENWAHGAIGSCYAAGSVTGQSYAGGLLGSNTWGSVDSCYFLDTAGPNNDCGTPLAHDAMKRKASFVDWNFNDTWRIDEAWSYPFLWWEIDCAAFGDPIGDDDHPIQDCGDGTTTGLLSVKWGRFEDFEDATALISDNGDRLELECVGGSDGAPYYALFYTSPEGIRRPISACPFVGGCNIFSFWHSGDHDGNGRPDCIGRTRHLSKDYGEDDVPNLWTRQEEEEVPPLLDWALSVFHVKQRAVFPYSYKYAYQQGPPVEGCTHPSGAEGAFRSFATVPWPWPGYASGLPNETGESIPWEDLQAFFNVIVEGLSTLPPDGPMSACLPSPSDYDFDGDVDLSDFSHFQNCMTGPEAEFLPVACKYVDLDGDDDVDLDDYPRTGRCLNGPYIPTVPGCAD